MKKHTIAPEVKEQVINRIKNEGVSYEIYQTVYRYNHTRIHSALKMPPRQFAIFAKTEYNSANKVGV